MDFVIIALAVAVAGILYFSGFLRAETPGGTAVIYVDGSPVTRLSLLNDIAYTVETENGWNIVEIEKGEVDVTDADCRDKICVNHKSISKVNESIVCLPHKVVVEIEEGEENSVDVIAQ